MAKRSGDKFRNILTGTKGNDQLFGNGGDDDLFGLDGHDLLDGGSGNDRMEGGRGNDSYVVDAVDDQVIERRGEGVDSVRSSVSYTLAEHVENLDLVGSAVSGVGNSLNNILTGNSGHNFLSGEAGNDIVFGGAGRDTLLGGSGNDILDGGADSDLLDGGSGSDLLNGGTGDDVLVYTASENSGSRDTYIGGKGSDTLRLVLTQAEAAAATADLAAFKAFLLKHSDPRALLGRSFTFKSIGLTVVGIERLELVVAGGNSAPTVNANVASIGEDAPAFSFDLLTGASDSDGPSPLSVQLSAQSVLGSGGLELLNGTHYALTGTNFALTSSGFALLNGLAQGATESFVIGYVVSDGAAATPNTLTLTVVGSNDAAVISGEITGTVVEDSAQSTATGLLTVTDVDSPAATFRAVSLPTASDNGYGTFSVTSEGAWTYRLDNGHPSVNGLAASETLSDSFTVLSDDGTAQRIQITVVGANDHPTIVSGAASEISEIAGASGSSSPLTATGTLSFIDVDLNDTGHSANITGVATSGATAGLPGQTALLGMLSLPEVTKVSGSSTGSILWNFSAADRQFDYLGEGETVTLTYAITIDDGDGGTAGNVIAITVRGTNDAPLIISADDQATVGISGPTNAVGIIAFSDLDFSDAHTTNVLPGAAGYLGDFSISLTNPATGDGTGTIEWSFAATSAELETLAPDEVRIQSYSVTVTDAEGALASRTVTITLRGPGGAETPPAPVILRIADDTGIFSNDAITSDPTLIVSGTSTPGSLIDVYRDGVDVGTAATDVAGSWTLDLSSTALADGTYAFTARARVGDNSSDSSQTLGVTIDTDAPEVSNVGLARSSDTAIAGDLKTAFSVVALTGQAEAGTIVRLDGTNISALVGNNGQFSLPGVALQDGINELTVRATDLAGNETSTVVTVEREGEAQDPVLTWIRATLEAIRADGSTPAFATRALAMQSLAVLDALNAIDGTPAYMIGLPAPAGADPFAAVAAAAHAILSHLFPAQRATFDARLSADLAAIADGAAETDGVALGKAIAAAVIAIRDRDGWDRFVDEPTGTAPGEWRPTAPMYDVPQAPQWAQLETFSINAPDQFRPGAPPALDSPEYTAALEEIRSLGSLNSTTRTAEQTQIARFWADGPATYTPPGHWNDIALDIATASGGSLTANARLFAQLNITLADASVAAWDTKYAYDFWRPKTAIQEADADGNPATMGDPNWAPFLISPSHPDYVSGHSTYSAAAAAVLTQHFGDIAFTTDSQSLPGVTRSFESFTQAAEEAGRSRIYGGIHYEFSNQTGQQLGNQVASWVMGGFRTDVDERAPLVLVDQANGQVTNDSITITGFALDNLAGLDTLLASIDGGTPQSVAVDASGKFSLPITLSTDGTADGLHTLVLSARDAAGNVSAPTTHTFTLDTRAPTITLQGLSDGGAIAAGARITGIADGTGSAIVALSYSVDGGPGRPLSFDRSTGAFDQALDLKALAAGGHTISISATDQSGFTSTTTVDVTLDALIPFAVESLTPVDRGGDIGVTVRPQVTFTRAVDPATLTNSTFYATDASGGILPAKVVTAPDGLRAWLFFDGPMPGGSNIKLNLDGDAIRAAADGAILDGDGNGLAGGDRVSSFTTVSQTPLPNTTITGMVVGAGPDLRPMTFDDIRGGPDGALHTADDVFLEPIANARVFILGFEDQAVFTDAQGRFTLTSVPGGNVKVAVDGRTATNAPTGVFYPEMVMDVNVRPGQVNTLMGTMGTIQEQVANLDRGEVYLPRLQTSILQTLSDTAPTVITAGATSGMNLTEAQREKLSITVQAGSALDANGQPVDNAQVGIQIVDPALVREMLPPGIMQLAATFTIQAPGVTAFAEPVAVTFPNLYNLAPGEKTFFYSFNHDTGLLEISGTATVSGDGLSVVTDPGQGVLAPGWFGPTPPGSRDQRDTKDEDPPEDPKDVTFEAGITGSGVLKPLTFDADFKFQIPYGELNTQFTFKRSLSWPSDDGIKWEWAEAFEFTVSEDDAKYIPTFSFSLFTATVKAGIEGIAKLQAKVSIEGGKTAAELEGVLGLGIQAVLSGRIVSPFLSTIPFGIGNALTKEYALKYPLLGTPELKVGPANFQLPFAPAIDFTHNIGPSASILAGTTFKASPSVFIRRAPETAQFATMIAADLAEIETQIIDIPDYLLSKHTGLGSDSRVFYVYVLDDATELRGVSDISGRIDQFLPQNSNYTLITYRPSSNHSSIVSGQSGASGGATQSEVLLSSVGGFDFDGDGIPDQGEFALGTSITNADTDGDGIADGAELAAGTNPLDGIPVATGVIAATSFQGEARAITVEPVTEAVGTTSVAFIATGSYGLAIADVSSPFRPVIRSELDLAGTASDVAVDANLGIAAVAAASGGLHLIDISDLAAPRLIKTIGVGATQVEIIDGIAIVNDAGNLKSFDLTTGDEIQILDLAGGATTVTGLGHEGAFVYVIDGSNVLHAIEVVNGLLMVERGSLTLPVGGTAARQLFVAEGVLYVPLGGGYATINVSNPSAMSLISGADAGNIAASAIALNGSGLGIAVGSVAGNAIDLVRTDDPVNTGDFVTRIPLPTTPSAVAIGNGLAFVGAGNQLQVVNYLAFDTNGVAPTVTLVRPPEDIDPTTPGIQVQEGQIIPFGVRVSDDVQVRDVELLVNGQVQRIDGAYPFDLRAVLPTIASNNGNTVTLQVRARDTGGNVGLSELVTVELVPDTVAPTLAETNVETGSTVGFSFRTLRFNFSEPIDPATVTAESFRLIGPDGIEVTPTAIQVKNSGFTVQLTYPPLAIGTHRIELDATEILDRAGNSLRGSADFSFALDSLNITRNGQAFFSDDFGDGSAPPNGPSGTATYGIGGAPTEASGRLILNSTGATVTDGTAIADQVLAESITLRTNIDPANLTAGLKSDDDFAVEATFDLILPDSPLERYGIRLTDRLQGGTGTPPDQLGDDIIELSVRAAADGTVSLVLRETDQVADTVTLLEEIPLAAPAGATQILLRLSHSTTDVGAIVASADYLADGLVLGTETFTVVGRIFGTGTPGDTSDDENWTRAQVIAIAPEFNDAPVISKQFDVAQYSIEWVAPTGGNAGTAANWSGNRIPGANDDVFIGLPAGQVVTFSSSGAEVATITATGATLQANAGTLTVSNGMTSSGPAVVSSGTLTGTTLTLNGNSTVGGLTHTGGVVAGSGNLTITGPASLTRGVQSGPGTTTVQSGATISQSSTAQSNWYYLDGGRSLQLDGSSQLSGPQAIISLNGGTNVFGSGSIRILAGATLNDQTTSTMQISAPSQGAADDGTDAIVINDGTFIKSGTAATSTISAAFNNNGIVDVQNGTLRLTGGGTDTSATYQGSGTIDFGGGTRTLDASSRIIGNAAFSGGSTTINGSFTGAGTITVNGGTANFASTVAAAALVQSAGLLTGSGTLTATGLSALSGGTQSGSGTTVLQGGASFTTANILLDAGRTLQLSGSSVATGSQAFIGLNFNNGPGSGTLRIDSGATFDDQTTNVMQIYTNNFGAADDGTDAIVINDGTFIKSGTAATSTISAAFNNNGIVDVQNGTLRLTGGGTDTGATYQGSGTIDFGGGTRTLDASSRIIGNAAFSGGSTTINGSFTGAGTITVNGGTANFASTVTAAALVQSAGLLTGSGTLTATGLSALSGGTQSGSGTTVLQGGASFTTANILLDAGRTLQLGGSSVATGSQAFIGLNFNNGPGSGTLRIDSGATFDDQTTSVMQIYTNNFGAADDGTDAIVINDGTFIKSGTAATSTISAAFNNNGIVDVQSGTLRLTGGGTDTGAIYQGSGTADFGGGTRTLDATSRIIGNATFSGGSTTINGSFTGAGTITVNGGTANFASTVAAAALVQSAGLLTGSGTLTATGLSALSGGTQSGSGTTVLQGGASFTTANILLDAGRTLQLGGSSVATGSQAFIGLNFNNGPGSGTLRIDSGATFDDQTTSVMQIYTNNFGAADDGTDAIVINDGTFIKSGTAATSTISAAFNNNGIVDVQSGTLRFSTPTNERVVTNSGTIIVDGGDLDVVGSIVGGTVEIGGSSSITTGALLSTLIFKDQTTATVEINSPSAPSTIVNLQPGSTIVVDSLSLIASQNTYIPNIYGTGGELVLTWPAGPNAQLIGVFNVVGAYSVDSFTFTNVAAGTAITIDAGANAPPPPPGNDILIATAQSDTFAFNADFGDDVIAGLQVSGPSHDIIEFSTDLFADWAAVEASMSDAFGAFNNFIGSVIATPTGDTLTIAQITSAQLQANHEDVFRFI